MESTDINKVGQPIFLGGYPKSGTTLLLSLLDDHPEILAFPEETKHLRHLHTSRRRLTADFLLQRTRLRKLRDGSGLVKAAIAGWHFDWPLFSEQVRQVVPRLPRHQILPAVVRAYADASHQPCRRFWAEKSPLNELYLGTARRLWPEMKAVYVVRDPRDVFASYRKKRARTKLRLPLNQFCAAWRNSVRAWDRYAARHPADACLVLYEDLARRPREALRPVCEMLHVAWTKTLLRPTIQGHLWRGNSMHGQDFDQVSQAAIGRYVHSISPAEQIRIESELAGYFDRFGWPRSTESSAVSARRWPRWKFWKAA